MSLIRKAIKLILGAFNIHLTSSGVLKQNKYRIDLLAQLGINFVVDIGANTGQYAMELIGSGYKNRITSFEPLNNLYDKLIQNSSKYPQWTVYDRCVTGDGAGEIEADVLKDHENSSTHNLPGKNVKVGCGTKTANKEVIKMVRLADVLKYPANSKIHLKINMQGFEEQVLSGAEAILGDIRSMEFVISGLQMKKETAVPPSLATKLTGYGYTLVHSSVLNDSGKDEILQLNGFFVKNATSDLIS